MSRRNLLIIAGLLLAAGFAWYVAERPMDFRVYHYGARGVADGTRPMYGPTSGMGWPMHYRYPPLFLFLFAPFAVLPMAASAAAWVLLKCAVLVLLIRAIWQRLGPSQVNAAWLVPLLLAGPYVVEDFRYGNAQFFVFALAALALLEAESRPMRAAAALALAISMKVWPLFFVPYLVARRQTRVAAWSLLLTVVLTMAPALFLGVNGTVTLLTEWARQEFSTQLGETEIWFPNQSLRGVLMRYLTLIDYSLVPDSNYPLVHVASLDPSLVRALWLVAAAVIYVGFLAYVWRKPKADALYTSALAFCLLALLQPFTQKYALVVLLFPALVVARSVSPWIIAAIAVVLIQPLIPGSDSQRLVQVLGMDFLATVLLTVGAVYDRAFFREGLTNTQEKTRGHRPRLQ